MRPLVILGAGGFARRVLALIDAINAHHPQFKVLGFLDRVSDTPRQIQRAGYEVLGGDSLLDSIDADYLIGVGSPLVRARLDGFASGLGRQAPIAIHPAAIFEPRVELSPGVMVMASGCVEADAVLGRHAYVNVHAVVGHDCHIGDHVTISPNAVVAGEAVLEDGVEVGANATVKQGCRVGRNSRVGANAMVARDVPPGITVVGVPARALESRK